jgi:hypothetical protein
VIQRKQKQEGMIETKINLKKDKNSDTKKKETRRNERDKNKFEES